jgi:hypothetical protein
VSAFAPRECCDAHRPVAATAAARDSGNQAAAHAGHHTGHHGNHGAPAATAAGHAHHHTAAPAAETASAGTASDHSGPGGRTCIMRGACNGPITAVVTLFLTPADPLDTYTLAADQAGTMHVGPAADPTLDLSPTVVTPPPRA